MGLFGREIEGDTLERDGVEMAFGKHHGGASRARGHFPATTDPIIGAEGSCLTPASMGSSVLRDRTLDAARSTECEWNSKDAGNTGTGGLELDAFERGLRGKLQRGELYVNSRLQRLLQGLLVLRLRFRMLLPHHAMPCRR